MKLLILTTLLFSHGAFADEAEIGTELMQSLSTTERENISKDFGECMANGTAPQTYDVSVSGEWQPGAKVSSSGRYIPNNTISASAREAASKACHDKVTKQFSKEGYSGKLVNTLNANNMYISEEVRNLAFESSSGSPLYDELAEVVDVNKMCSPYWYTGETVSNTTNTARAQCVQAITAELRNDNNTRVRDLPMTEYLERECPTPEAEVVSGDSTGKYLSQNFRTVAANSPAAVNGKFMYTSVRQCASVLGGNFLTQSRALSIASEAGTKKICMDFAYTYGKGYFSSNGGDAMYVGTKCNENSDEKCQRQKKVFADEITSYTSDPKYMKQMISACAGLASLSRINNETLDDLNETSYAAIDFDRSGLICTKPQPFTLDYTACRTSVYWYNGTFLTNDLLAPVVTNAYGQLKTSDIQSEAYAQQSQGGVAAQTAAYEAQKKQFKLRAKQEQIKGATESVKAMAMFGNMMNFPSPKFVSEKWCSDRSDNELGLNPDYSCSIMFAASQSEELRRDLFANTAMKGKLLAVGAQSLAKAVVAAIVANSYKKQANMVDGVIQDFEQADFNQPENQLDFGSEFCKQNPDSPSCGGSAGRTPTTTGIDFNFGGNGPTGGGEIEFGEDGDIADSGSNEALSPTGTTGGTDELGSILGSGGGDKGGSSFSAPGAAKIGAANSTGGSGSGGGGAAAGGGGGGGGPGKKGGKAQGAFGAKIKPTYAKGGNFKGGGTVRAKSKSKNLFDNLTKNRSRNLASQSGKNLGAKNSRLFQTISKRYNAVQKEGGRLMVSKDK